MSDDDDDQNGIRLIAAHLAQVKLSATENEYQARKLIRELEDELDATKVCLEEARRDITSYRNQVKELQYENTYKALVNERDKWKGLIDTLRSDKNNLLEEVARLRNQLSKMGVENADNAQLATKTDSNSANINKDPADENNHHESKTSYIDVERFENEIYHLRNQLREKNVEIDALREKLDRELELKWETTHEGIGKQDNANERSFFDNVLDIFAPIDDDEDQVDDSANTTTL